MRTLLLSALLLTAQTLFGAAGMSLQNAMYPASLNVTSTTWSPTNLSGLQIWMDANTLTGNDGDQKNGWPDSAPGYESRFCTNRSSPSRGAFLAKSWMGGTNNALRFFGTNVMVFSNAWSVLRNIGSSTFIMVCRPNDTAGTVFPAYFSRNTAGTSRQVLGFTASENVYGGGRTQDGDGGKFCTNATVSPTNLIVCLKLDVTNSEATYSFETNNVSVGSCGAYNAANNTSDTDSTDCLIGAASTAGGNGFAGEVAEFVVVVPTISASDWASYWTYLRAKYGL